MEDTFRIITSDGTRFELSRAVADGAAAFQTHILETIRKEVQQEIQQELHKMNKIDLEMLVRCQTQHQNDQEFRELQEFVAKLSTAVSELNRRIDDFGRRLTCLSGAFAAVAPSTVIDNFSHPPPPPSDLPVTH